MSVKGDEVKGGKKSKERITLLLACSAEGEMLMPFVIGHSANPRCFKGLASLACLPVSWKDCVEVLTFMTLRPKSEE